MLHTPQRRKMMAHENVAQATLTGLQVNPPRRRPFVHQSRIHAGVPLGACLQRRRNVQVLSGLALALALGGAQAEVTARHAYVSFDTVAAAQKNARADELVYFRGHITAEPEDGVYVFEDGTGNVRVEIPNEARTGVTLRRDVRYEVFGRALRLPFEELRVQAETLTPISGK